MPDNIMKLLELTEKYYPAFHAPVEKRKNELMQEMESGCEFLESYQFSQGGVTYQCIPGCDECCDKSIKILKYSGFGREFTDSIIKVFGRFLSSNGLVSVFKDYKHEIKSVLKDDVLQKISYLAYAMPIIYHNFKEKKDMFKSAVKELLDKEDIAEEIVMFSKCFFFSYYGCSIHNLSRPTSCNVPCLKRNIIKNQS